MRSKKNMQKKHFTHIRLIISRSPKERDEYINSQIQNVCTKSLLRIHSVQHYYRNASTERTPPQSVARNLPFAYLFKIKRTSAVSASVGNLFRRTQSKKI